MILVCGDFMLDQYWFGEVKRISPEAPVPIFSVKRTEERLGGAANVADNVRAMGVECIANHGPQDQKILKTRLIARGQQIQRIDNDYPQKPIEYLGLDGVSLVILIDYGKGSLANVQRLIQQAKGAGKTVLVDPKGYDYEKYRGADVIKPNLDEMKVMVGGWKDEEDLAVKVEQIRKGADIGAVLLTRASEGMSFYTSEGALHIYAVGDKVVDVTGAGETAIAALGVGLHRGLSPGDSVRMANVAAGIKVGKFGPSVVSKEEIEAFRSR